MSAKQRILVASDSALANEALQSALGSLADYAVETRLLGNGQRNPLQAIERMPDLLILRVGANSVCDLDVLAETPAGQRPPLLVIADEQHAGAMRAAMRVGARDFLVEPVVQEELIATIAQIGAERLSGNGSDSLMTAFINAQGGSGSTFLASNVAYLLAGVSGIKTALVDLDLGFGPLHRYLDVQPKRSLLEALEVAEDLDATAIDAYLTKHASGLAILASARDSATAQAEPSGARFEAMLALLMRSYAHVVVDVPRYTTAFAASALERADRIVVVLQQSVPGLHDAVRQCEFLTRNLAIPKDRLITVVNRHHKAASIECTDIEQALGGIEPICIPSDFRAVSESINIGVPIYEHARRSAVTKALLRLEGALGGKGSESGRGFFPRLGRTGS